MSKHIKIAVVSKRHYFLRLKYFLLGYTVSVRPNPVGGVK